MNNDPTVHEWLARYGDWLAAAEFLALLSASVTGFVQRIKGMAMLTNAPRSGNPTKWIPVNDNGTTRYIPAW